MRISKITMPKGCFDDGLAEIEMKKLGDMVVIAGKNGSGKSRLLERIKNNVNAYISKAEANEISRSINMLIDGLGGLVDPQFSYESKKEIEELQEKLEPLKYIHFADKHSKFKALSFVPKRTELKKIGVMTLEEQAEAYNKCVGGDLENLHDKTNAYINEVWNDYFTSTHPDSEKDYTAEEIENICSNYKNLDDLIFAFLGVRIGKGIRRNCTLFGLMLDNAKLSEGQSILLQLCVAIHAQGASLDNLILILDEPESHLHPKALTDFYNKIRDVLKNGQIWIATHSINLLSQVDASCIWYMKDNAIEYAGKVPEDVLDGLLGSEDERIKLHDFVGLPDTLANIRFACECLIAPKPLTNDGDRQTAQIQKYIKEQREKKGKVCVLDYGAGKGRLINSMSATENAKDWLNYIAYDKYSSDDDVKICKNAIESVYDTSEERLFRDLADIEKSDDIDKVNIAVMCNVLHEIPGDEWVSILNSKSPLYRLLADDGFLLIVEVLELPVGEQPHNMGFLVLWEDEVKELFALEEGNNVFCRKHEKNADLVAYTIPKKALKEVTNATYKKAIEMLKDNSLKEVKELRESGNEGKYKAGRKHAFWSQQYINAMLALVEAEKS